MDEKDNSVIEISLKLAVIYGSWKDHAKANSGFHYCIDAQENKMKSSKFFSPLFLQKQIIFTIPYLVTICVCGIKFSLDFTCDALRI